MVPLLWVSLLLVLLPAFRLGTYLDILIQKCYFKTGFLSLQVHSIRNSLFSCLIMRDINFGWLLRYLHANGASVFFIFVYIHIGRGLYFSSYKSPRTLPWSIGVIMLVLMMGIAFLGYVLPYGQMSLWGSQIFLCPTYVILIIVSIRSFYDFITIYLYFNRIAKRIPAIRRVGPHNYNILSVFYGSLLGDALARASSYWKRYSNKFLPRS